MHSITGYLLLKFSCNAICSDMFR